MGEMNKYSLNKTMTFQVFKGITPRLVRTLSGIVSLEIRK